MGLGNGGLGRTSPPFSSTPCATLISPGIGYGIHYQYGLFRQEFRSGHRSELPDAWIGMATPWEIVRPEHATEIRSMAASRMSSTTAATTSLRWMGWKS